VNKLVKLLVSMALASALPAIAQSTADNASASASANTSTAATPKKAVAKKTTSKKAKVSKAEEAPTPEDEAKESEVTASTSYVYKCELGNSLTVYTNADDSEHIAMRWKTHIWRMIRIPTTTGADRFENHRIGLVWIGIPSKGMLLDSRKGLQLANECKTHEQEVAESQPTTASTN
jgi:cell division septation protein DedD